MKISKRDKGILIAVAGLLVLFFAYQFIYTSNVTKKDTAESQLASLKVTEANLVNLDNNMDYYKSEITRLTQENDEVISHYPANILPEDEIMYVRQLEQNNAIYFSSLSYGSASDISTGYESSTGITGKILTLTGSYQSTYEGLKNTITYNNNQNNRMVISGVTASFDSTTGDLTGTITLKQYYMTGTSQTYTRPIVPDMNIGLSNIFATFENK